MSEAQIEPEFGHKIGLERKIHYTLTGKDSSKPLLVFVHGSPGSSSNFIHFAKDNALLMNFQILLLDRPGFGYSDFGHSEPSMNKQAAILNEVVHQFNAPRIILVGHSLGGPIIARMAMDTTIAIDGLVLLAASVAPELEPKEAWRRPMDSPWLRWLLPKSFRVSNQEIIPARKELKIMEPMWPRITSRVVIIHGGKDKLVPVENADYAKEKLVNARQVIMHKHPDLNHFIPFSQPELVISALLEVFKD